MIEWLIQGDGFDREGMIGLGRSPGDGFDGGEGSICLGEISGGRNGGRLSINVSVRRTRRLVRMEYLSTYCD